jgi:succinate dehydrogenase / fumarate reductase flavoprotein subunit
MSNIPGLHVIGEANFSDHGANRLGASALMQGLADGYFVLPYTIGNFIGSTRPTPVTTDRPEFAQAEKEVAERMKRLLALNGKYTVTSIHRELGKIMWEYCGMARNEAGLKKALELIPPLREQFWNDANVPGESDNLNIALEKAGRVADFLEFAELLCYDALERDESCGSHFREEHQHPDGEAKRNDADFCFVSAWEHKGVGQRPALHKEPLIFENVELGIRSYK